MIRVQELLERAAIQLYDESLTNWSEPELIAWLDEALGALAGIRPDLFMQTSTVQLVPGCRQQTMNGSIRVIRVLATRETESGPPRAVTQFDIRSMSAARPDWQGDPPGRMRQFALVNDADVFYCYPPQPQPAHWADIEHVRMPEIPDPGADGYAGIEIDVDPRFKRTLLDYMLYRAYAKDAESASVQQAGAYYQAFEAGAHGERMPGEGVPDGRDR